MKTDMDLVALEKIEEHNAQLKALELLKRAVMEAVGPYIEPILASGDIEQMEKLEDLLYPGYWQFETRVRLRHARRNAAQEKEVVA